MARRVALEDDWDDEEEDWHGEDDEDYGGEDEETIPCPYCKRQIHEEAVACPYCGEFISAEDAPPTRKPWWIIMGTLLCLYAVYRWVAG